MKPEGENLYCVLLSGLGLRKHRTPMTVDLVEKHQAAHFQMGPQNICVRSSFPEMCIPRSPSHLPGEAL